MPHMIGRRKVRFTNEEVADFHKQWPCHGMQTNRSYWFEFAANGDLVDTDVPEHSDGPAALAMSHDAQSWLDDNPDAKVEDPVLHSFKLKT